MAFLDDLQGWMKDAASQFGVSTSYLATTAQIESGTNPNAAGGGLFQFRGAAMTDVGLSNPLDPKASTFGAAQLAATNTAYLSNTLGRAPSDWEVYLAHQQGAAGATNILQNPGQYASSGVSNFLGNINVGEFKQLTGVDVNNPAQVATNADFASYWKQKYQATSGQTDPALSITGIGAFGGGNTTSVAQAAASAAVASNPLAAAAMGATSGGASGGDVSTWTKWLEHQLVRGTVVVTGFLFLGTGLGLFALSAVFRSNVGSTIAGAYIGGRVAGKQIAAGSPKPQATAPEVVPLTRVESPASAPLSVIDIVPDMPSLAPPTAADIETALGGLTLRNEPVTEALPEPKGRSIWGEMDDTMKHYRRTMEAQPIGGSPRERNVHGTLVAPQDRRNPAVEEKFKPRAKKPIVQLATAEATTPTGRRKKSKDYLGESAITPKGRARIAQGWNTYAAKFVPKTRKVAKIAAVKQPNAAELAAQEEASKRVGSARKPANTVAESLPSFEGIEVGKFVVLKDPKGAGRPNEPLKVLSIWRDQMGVGVQVKGEKSGTGMFPASEFTPERHKVHTAKRKSLLTRLGVIRDFTKPKPKA